MGETPALAPLPQRTLDGWHRFVASGDPDDHRCLSVCTEDDQNKCPKVSVSLELNKESAESRECTDRDIVHLPIG